MVEYKKFKINEILNPPIAGDTDIQGNDISNKGEIVITSGLTNSDIKGRTTKKLELSHNHQLL